MMRRAALLAALLSGVLVVPTPAGAATAAVSIENHSFNPPTVRVAQGDTVTWTQNEPLVQHTSTSDQGFWHSPDLSTGDSYSQTAAFRSAGRYGYHCAIHPDMTGAVLVPMKASGTASTGWRLRWSSLSTTPANRAFDVQIKRPGSTTWAAFRTDTAARTAFFDPSRTGDYRFRARTRNLGNASHSGWSPVLVATIT
jgi:plastocyanin